MTIAGLNTSRGWAQGLIDAALADGGNVDQLLLSIEKNDAKHFTIEKALQDHMPQSEQQSGSGKK